MAFTQQDKDRVVKIQQKIDELIAVINDSVAMKATGASYIVNSLIDLKPDIDALASKEVDSDN